MSETEFTPFLSLAGGAMIGGAAVLLLSFYGRIAGISGIVSSVLPPYSGSRVSDSAFFLAGMICATVPLVLLFGYWPSFTAPVSTSALIFGGLLAGIGVTFGSGCTSGHGVCGLSRFSVRSAVGTLVFMAAAFATVYLVRHVI